MTKQQGDRQDGANNEDEYIVFIDPERPWLALVFALAACCGAALSFNHIDTWQSWPLAGLALWLSFASYIDWRVYLLLDMFTLPLIVAGLALSVVTTMPGLLDAALGAAIGYGALWAVARGYQRWRGISGLGLGDAKLLAGAGAWCGALALPALLLGASLAALIWVGVCAALGRAVTARTQIAFGPFIALSFFSCAFLQRSEFAVRGLF